MIYRRFAALDPWRRLYVISALVWVPVILLIAVLGSIYGHTREWTAMYVSIATVGFVVGSAFVVLGTVRRIKDRSRGSGAR